MTDPSFELTVLEVIEETGDARSVVLDPGEYREHFTYTPGQFLTVAVPSDRTGLVARSYSLSSTPVDVDGPLTITVKRTVDGYASGWICEKLQAGDRLRVLPPAGIFTPKDLDADLLLFAGGSGITPVMSMLRTMRDEGSDREIAFVHYARTPQEACYRDELMAMPGVRVLHGYSRAADAGQLQGHFDADHLAAAMPDADAVFVCGPQALVDAIKEHYPDARSESFVPPAFAVPTEASGGTVAFADSGVDVIDDGRSLLEQAEAAGLSPQSGCRMGICHTCTRRKTSGAVKNLITGAVSTADEEDVQICVSAPVGDVELAL